MPTQKILRKYVRIIISNYVFNFIIEMDQMFFRVEGQKVVIFRMRLLILCHCGFSSIFRGAGMSKILIGTKLGGGHNLSLLILIGIGLTNLPKNGREYP